RLTPRFSYCRRTSSITTGTSMPSGRRAASAFCETGSADAKTIASAMRTASARCRRPAGLSMSASSPESGAKGMTLAPLSVMDHVSRYRLGSSLAPPAQEQRRERRVLADLDLPLAHQFETGGKGTGNRGRPLLGRRHVADQERVERGPVADFADKTGQDLAGFLERPHATLCDPHIGDRLPLALRGIRRQQV